jgi:riboflavin biosynthesis pyrimidine reductase
VGIVAGVPAVGGPTFAAHAIRTGLVDEYHLFVVPIMLGGGKQVLPSNVCVKLDLRDERRIGTIPLIELET